MPRSRDILFQAEAANRSFFADWHLEITPEQQQLHQALATRTLKPTEANLHHAANWIATLFRHNQSNSCFDFFELATTLEEKSSLIHRMAYAHVPLIAGELESATSPLYPVDAAARFLPTAIEEAAGPVVELRAAIIRQALPEAVPPGSDLVWHQNRRRLQQLVLHDNPARFLTWPVIINSMFMNDAEIAGPELVELLRQPDFTTRWRPALQEDAVGAPARSSLLEGSSNNLIHHAYNLWQFERHTKRRIADLSSIVEFGGGYGSTARLAARLGFRGQYAILDLPEFSALQRYYIGAIGIAKVLDIHFVQTICELPVACQQPDLFLATWSLSETPLGVRATIESLLRRARQLLIAYQDSFGGINNRDYFTQMAALLSAQSMADYVIPHLTGNRYFVSALR